MSAMTTELSQAEEGPSPKKNVLTVQRAQALQDRVLQRRLRLVDRFNSISVPGIREPGPNAKAWDGKVCPGDPPPVQLIFYLGKMLKETDAIDDPYNRINARSGITKQMGSLFERFGDQDSKIVAEVQKFIEMERSHGEPTDEELAKLAEQA